MRFFVAFLPFSAIILVPYMLLMSNIFRKFISSEGILFIDDRILDLLAIYFTFFMVDSLETWMWNMVCQLQRIVYVLPVSHPLKQSVNSLFESHKNVYIPQLQVR